MRRFRPGGELVDGRRVDGDPALTRALVVVLAAPRAEEVPLRPLAVRAYVAAALGHQRHSPSLARPGPECMEFMECMFNVLPFGG